MGKDCLGNYNVQVSFVTPEPARKDVLDSVGAMAHVKLGLNMTLGRGEEGAYGRLGDGGA